MLLYNVTVSVEEDAIDAWKSWMKETHIPAVLATGCFTNARFLKLHHEPENFGETFAIQYECSGWLELNEYLEKHAPGLRQQMEHLFPNKTSAFRTVLESVD